MVTALSTLQIFTLLTCAVGLQSELGAQLTAPSPSPPAAPAPPAADNPALDILSFEQDEHARMTVPVSVAGQGPYPFLVDTGAERTVISRELARRLKLDAGRTVTVHSMSEVSEVGTAVIPNLEVSKRSFNDVHAPALSAAHLGAAGMLGVDSLQSQRVVFDFDERTMTITPARKRLRDWGRDAIVINGRSLYGRLVLVDAEVEWEDVLVVLDTGSQVSIGNEALRRKLAAKNKLRVSTEISLLSVTGGRVKVDYTSIRRIRIGDIFINDMPIGFGDVHPFHQLDLIDRPAMLLGMDALQLFDRVAVDFARKEIRFQLDEATSERTSGMRLAGLRRQGPPEARMGS